MEFPCLVYKSHQTYKLVEFDEDLTASLSDGWFMTPGDALSPPVVQVAPVAPVVEPVAEPDASEDAKLTRAELEELATSKGIKFDGRTSDAKLEKLISEAE